MLPLLSATFLPFRSATRPDRRALGHQHRFGLRTRHRRRHIGQRRAGGLRKDRRRFADVAEVDGADVQRLELHRAGGELGPLDRHAQRRKALLQRAAALEQAEVALLVADAQLRWAQVACGQGGQGEAAPGAAAADGLDECVGAMAETDLWSCRNPFRNASSAARVFAAATSQAGIDEKEGGGSRSGALRRYIAPARTHRLEAAGAGSFSPSLASVSTRRPGAAPGRRCNW